jgi:hypothetical protein
VYLMNNNFLTETVRFLNQSDLRLYPTDIRKVELKYEEDKVLKMIKMSFSDTLYSKPQISNNFILQVIVIFSTLDAKIDLEYPELQGQSFKYKYENLPCEIDEEIILKECFRIFKLLRNAATHSMNSISVSNGNIIAHYNFRDTAFNLQMTQKGISLLFTYILELFSSKTIYSNNHYKAFNRELFDLIKKEISVLSDEFGCELKSISNSLKLKRWLRYYIENPTFDLNNETNKLKIYDPYVLSEDYEKEYGVDYLINISDGVTYLIPGELLNDQYEIEFSQITDWEITN